MGLDTFFISSVSIYTKAPTKDASGGQVSNFTPSSNAAFLNLPCSIQPHHGSTRVTLGQRQVFLSHNIYLPSNPGILRGMKAVNDVTGESYLIHGVVDMGGQGSAFRLEVTLET